MIARKLIHCSAAILLFIFLILLTSYFLLKTVKAIDEKCSNPSALNLDEVEQCLPQLNDELNRMKTATKPLEGQLESLQRQLVQIQVTIDNLVAGIAQKQKDLDVREDKLALQQALLEQRIKAYYIRSYLTDPLLVILSSFQAGDLFRELSYRQFVTREDRQIISSITTEVVNLLTEKEKLEKDKVRLAVIQADVDKNAKFLGGEIKKAKVYQADLSSKIVALTARQQQILSQRLASLHISRSAASIGVCIDDRNVSPGFGNAIAFFTYGAPHRVGMNQYGAKGRAEAGQGRDDILKAYYTNFETIKWDTNIKIKVQGSGEFLLEDYVLRIYEVPESWPMAALEAQAIAARSFALAYTDNGSGEICTSESCQVFKPDPKTGAWAQAVKNTEGLVMASGGNPIKAWYASTHGGYIFSSAEVWGGGTPYTKHATDTTTGSAGNFGDLQSNAYDRSSPWFYCDWGSRSQYNKTAWLKSEEVADIVNTLLLIKADGSTSEHLYQTDKPNPAGTDNWDENKVKQELKNKSINPYTSVSGISVSADFGRGETTLVNISGDGGSDSFSGADFKNRFNLRAPANIQIVGPLFNIEQK